MAEFIKDGIIRKATNKRLIKKMLESGWGKNTPVTEASEENAPDENAPEKVTSDTKKGK